MKKLLFIIVYLSCLSLIHAQPSYQLADFKNYEVTEKHPIDKTIQEMYVGILKATEKDTPVFDTLFHNGNCAYNLHQITGLSLKMIKKYFKKCYENNLGGFFDVLKSQPKKYHVIIDPEMKIPFDSWTNTENKTYIVVQDDKPYIKNDLSALKHLLKILVHELYINFDGKFKATYTTYFADRNKYYDRSQALAEESQNTELNKLFSISHNIQIARTFALMRAFNYENIAKFGKPLAAFTDHTKCSQDFSKYYNLMKQNSQFSLFLERSTESTTEDASINDIDSIMSANKIISLPDMPGPEKNFTFCQYMIFPTISLHFNSSKQSNGPRPRTGGWGGEGGDTE